MFVLKKIGRFITIGAVLVTSSAWADFVILESDAAGIDAGLVVNAGANITVPEGATVLVINDEGQTMMVLGPFTGKLGDAGEVASEEMLGRITAARQSETKVLGAVRAPRFEGGSIEE
ncbi:MAG: hypothetical protein ACPGGK_16005 [Pikeienuella sp.]